MVVMMIKLGNIVSYLMILLLIIIPIYAYLNYQIYFIQSVGLSLGILLILMLINHNQKFKIKYIISILILVASIIPPVYAYIKYPTYFVQSFGLSVGILLLLLLIPVGYNQKVRKMTIQVGENVENIAERINSAIKEIKIVSGEAHNKVYDNSIILEAIRRAIDRGVKIMMICGPDIVVDGDADSNPTKIKPLIKIAIENKNNFEFYLSDRRQNEHFMLIDKNHVYKEAPHEQLASIRQSTEIENSFWEANRLELDFDKIKNGFSRIMTIDGVTDHLYYYEELKSKAIS
jgi:hypothetical protein